MNEPHPALHAHTPREPGGPWDPLEAHLAAVAERARAFAEPFGGGDIARFIGLWHDLGKADPAFQAYLRAAAEGRKHPKTPHAAPGAVLPYAFYWLRKHDPERWKELSLPIAGHHGGLGAADRLGQKLDECLGERPETLAAVQALARRLPSVWPPISPKPDRRRRELFIRMLFSALVDADYLATETHLNPEKGGGRGSKLSSRPLRPPRKSSFRGRPSSRRR